LEADGETLGTWPYALNDIAVLKRDSASMITIDAAINGEHLVTYQADGLIVSTPTGSTAYSLSAGGPIIAPNAKNFVITPIATHNLTVRPVVIPDDSTIRIQVEGREKKFVFSMDSRSCTLDTSVQLEVRKAGFCLNLVRMRGEDFFGTIRNKLMWGKDNRN
jgi:NAD+ kinase